MARIAAKCGAAEVLRVDELTNRRDRYEALLFTSRSTRTRPNTQTTKDELAGFVLFFFSSRTRQRRYYGHTRLERTREAHCGRSFTARSRDFSATSDSRLDFVPQFTGGPRSHQRASSTTAGPKERNRPSTVIVTPLKTSAVDGQPRTRSECHVSPLHAETRLASSGRRLCSGARRQSPPALTRTWPLRHFILAVLLLTVTARPGSRRPRKTSTISP